MMVTAMLMMMVSRIVVGITTLSALQNDDAFKLGKEQYRIMSCTICMIDITKRSLTFLLLSGVLC